MRPERVVVVAGTGTEVGKTFVGAAIAHSLREQGHRVIARKPAQSNAPEDTVSDALVLGSATGEPPEVVCPKHRWYRVPLAPPMAAAVLQRPPFGIADLVLETTNSWPHETADVALVETAGGAWSPQASDGRHVGDFAAELDADAILLVADPNLGVINSVRGAAAAFAQRRPIVVFLNRFDPARDLHAYNLTWLTSQDHFTVVTSAAEAAAMLVAI